MLDDGLGHAEFVDAVVQGLDVLLDGVVFFLRHGGRRQTGAEAVGACGRLRGQLQIGMLTGDEFLGRVQCAGIDKNALKGVAHAFELGVARVLVAQIAAQLAGNRVELFVHGRLHVHLQQEVHAPAQVETEVHGIGVERRQPRGRTRQQIDRDHIPRIVRIGVERLGQHIARLELHAGVAEAVVDRGAVEVGRIGLEVSRVQNLLAFEQQGVVHLAAVGA